MKGAVGSEQFTLERQQLTVMQHRLNVVGRPWDGSSSVSLSFTLCYNDDDNDNNDINIKEPTVIELSLCASYCSKCLHVRINFLILL